MRFDEQFILGAVPGAIVLYKKFPENLNFVIDSRTLKSGDVFVAIKGAKVDSHCFVEDVIKSGASGLIISLNKKDVLKKIDKKLLSEKLVILVPDTVQALISMATVWRSKFKYPVIAITGSVGKTSTKDFLSNILLVNGTNHLSSYGNQNTAIGLSLNILKMRPEHKMAVFEVGINARGES